MQTHETYIKAVANIAKARLPAADQAIIGNTKIAYGTGRANLRGTTYYSRWINGDGPDCPHTLIEICAFGESDIVQLAGTTLHEIAHALVGPGVGHGKGWKDTCARVGLTTAKAAGQEYSLDHFAPDIRDKIASLTPPQDGQPVSARLNGAPSKPRPCSAAIGVKGGKSRGVGSGSRLLKVECTDCGYVARVSGKWLATGAPICPCNHKPMEQA